MNATLYWKRAVRSRFGSRKWRSECGRYLVHASEHCLGVDLRPIVYSAWHDAGRGWRKLSKHRTKAAAITSCEKHARSTARKGVQR
jgi:hypothetical protein